MSSYKGRTQFTQGRGFVMHCVALTLRFATGGNSLRAWLR
jgi:hypothetical protein